MKISALAAIAGFTAIAVAGLTATAHAEVRTIYRSGAWATIAGTANDGSPTCGVTVKGEDRGLAVKWFKDELLLVHVRKNSWHIPAGTKMPMSIAFDQQEPWEGLAYQDGDNLIVMGIAKPESFISQLAYANSMTIRFLVGTETPWSATMTGSQGAVERMRQCVTETRQAAVPKTQPYAAVPAKPFTAPTQPFSSTAPTQPAPTRRDFTI
jgi:hypothetical protein